MGKSDFIFRYRVRNWPVYNRVLVGRGNLTFWIDEQAVESWRGASGSSARGGRPRVKFPAAYSGGIEDNVQEWKRDLLRYP